ncbi:MAG: hypothetical protein ACD_46C00023G0005 [uncultured bacterium]|nr:MAG: hypothetical protein ACD_46C00023G0005 [uncultured bacterium]
MIHIKTILVESWKKTQGNKRNILSAFAVYIVCYFFMQFSYNEIMEFIFYFPYIHQILQSLNNAPVNVDYAITLFTFMISAFLLRAIIFGFLLTPMFAGILMMGVYVNNNLPIKIDMLFHYYRFIFKLGLAYILFALFLLIPITLFLIFIKVITFIIMIIFVPYIVVSYSMFIPLIIENKLGIWQALETSRKVITKQWFNVFGFYICLFCIIVISALPIGIGLIWSLPFAFISYGNLYNKLFVKD